MDKRTLILTLATMAVTAAWADDIPQPERMTWEEQPAAEPPPAELQPPAAPVQVAAAPAPAADAVPMPTPVAPDAPPLVTTPPPAPSVAAPATPSAAAVPPAVRAAVSDAVPKAPYAAVRVDTGLRDRPVTTAAGDLLIAAGTLVHLSGKAVNAEGTWWFVTATGIGGGWLPESDLGPITR